MTKTHKDIALFMVQLSEKKSLTERDIMQEIGRKTKELIENLRWILLTKNLNQNLINTTDPLHWHPIWHFFDNWLYIGSSTPLLISLEYFCNNYKHLFVG